MMCSSNWDQRSLRYFVLALMSVDVRMRYWSLVVSMHRMSSLLIRAPRLRLHPKVEWSPSPVVGSRMYMAKRKLSISRDPASMLICLLPRIYVGGHTKKVLLCKSTKSASIKKSSTMSSL